MSSRISICCTLLSRFACVARLHAMLVDVNEFATFVEAAELAAFAHFVKFVEVAEPAKFAEWSSCNLSSSRRESCE